MPTTTIDNSPDDDFYRSLFENSAAGIGRTDWDSGRVLIANARLAEIFGYEDREEFVRNFNFTEHYPDEDGRQQLLEFYQEHPGKLARTMFTRKDGSLVHVEAEVRLDMEQRFIDFVLIDVSELMLARNELQQNHDQLESLVAQRTEKLRESEEIFRSFYEVIPDISMITSLKGGIVKSVNQGFIDTTGFERDEIVGKSTLRLDLWRDNSDRDRLVAGLKQKGMIGNLNAEFRKKDGSFWPGIMAACIVQLDGRPHVLSTTVDVSELRRVQDMAIKANQAKSQFLSSMSHELRTPLNAILGFTQVLQMADNLDLTDKQLRAFEIIRKSGEHLLQLINRILELSRIEAGNLELELCSLAPAPLIEECIEMMAGAAQMKSISITNEADGADLPLVLTDASRTRQILLNLLSNAIKYNHDGGSVVVRAKPRDGVGLRINIIDSGYGFSDHEHARVFEPFDRLGKADSETPGAGIGLAISKQLIEAIGGAIDFSSKAGAGSDFWIDLPLCDATEQPPIAVLESDATPVHRHSNRRRRRVLYIEDNMTNFELMENIFEDVENAELLHTPDAESGIELATANPPDLILMDISLPGMDGIEATRILQSQSRTRAIPVIGISAAAMADDLERARDVGFHAYKTKPFQIDEFLHTIHLVMDQFSA